MSKRTKKCIIQNTKNKKIGVKQQKRKNYVIVEKYTNLLSTSQNVSPKIKNYGSVQNKKIIQRLYKNKGKKIAFSYKCKVKNTRHNTNGKIRSKTI